MSLDEVKRRKLEEEKKRIAAKEKIKEEFREILMLNSQAGVNVLKLIFLKSGYNKSNVVVNSHSGSLDSSSMFYNEGRRNLWLEVREFISPQMRRKIEE